MQQDCLDCQRLWREYSSATNSHVALETRLREAVQSPNGASAETLRKEVAAAAEMRQSARQAIERHEAEAHGGTASAADLGA